MLRDSTQVVAHIVRDVLGERPVAVEHVPTLEHSEVFRVHLASGVVYFKSEHEGHSVAAVAWAYEKAAHVGVPAPEVLHLDLTREHWPNEFVLMTAVTGTDLEHHPLDGADLVQAIEGYGGLLRRLHGIAIKGFGDLSFPTASAREPVGLHSDHASYVRESPNWGLPYLTEHRLVSAEAASRIRDILARHEELFPSPDQGVLLHGDAGLDHLFVEREQMRITGLIDFEPRSADPVLDLAIFAFHYPDLAGYLLDGYGTRPVDLELRFELYGLLRAIGSARWEHERGWNIDQPLNEIARRSSRLMTLLSEGHQGRVPG